MYRIRRCKVCNHEVHAHKKSGKFIIKDACEHIDASKKYTEATLREITYTR